MIITPSPNCDDRMDGAIINTIVIHYTGMKTAQEALDRLRDTSSSVSAHYLIDEEGELYRLVEEEDRAWHAGVSHWRGMDGLNQHSIGIELVNPGEEHGYKPFPKAQMHTLVKLCNDLIDVHPIQDRNIIGHADIAPTRKADPGEKFDWQWLSEAGIGLYPFTHGGQTDSPVYDVPWEKMSELLIKLGYKCESEEATWAALKAFQRHWRPVLVNGQPDRDTLLRLRTLLQVCGEEVI